jgi:hypothetical protein
MEKLKGIRRLAALLDESDDDDVETSRPQLRRTKTIVPSEWGDENEKALYKDFVSDDVSYVSENGDGDESEKVDTPNVLRTSHQEFQHLQQGVLGIFYQNEHHTKHLHAKLEEIEKSVASLLDIINIMNARTKILEDELAKCNKKVDVGTSAALRNLNLSVTAQQLARCDSEHTKNKI